MTVGEAIKTLLDMPQDAQLMICSHEFKGGENKAWEITSFDKVTEDFVFIEGAWPLAVPDEDSS